MPSIVAVGYPDRGHVLLEINFADVPGATHVCVTASHGDTVRQLHPYVSYNEAGCQALSCGQAILWDTEAPCDVPVTYCATATDTAGTAITAAAAPLILATFSTAAAASWPPADTGQTWTNTGGAAADYSGTGTRGQHAVTTTNVTRLSTIPMTTANATAQVTMIPGVVATVQPFNTQLRLRADVAALNFYRILLAYTTAGNVDLFLQKRVAGVTTGLGSSAAAFTYTAASQFKAVLQVWGSQVRAKVWDATTPEPAAWTFTVTDTDLTAAENVALASFRDVGNTNAGLTTQYDDFSVFGVCDEPVPVEVCTDPVTLACDGCFRLGDPVRPCNDVRICLCADGVECGGDGGLFFAGMNPDSYPDNSGNMLPVNAVYPIHISRNRRSASGVFTIIPMSFADRDDLLQLLAPGSVLLWRGPAEYGTGDRYLAVGEVPVAPPLADLRQQPRVMQLPFVVMDAVTGPSLGVCGARVTDLCDVYDTWDDIAAAGLTWADLLRGNASATPAALATWDSIDAEHADWNALQAAETDWTDVLDGD